VDGQITIGDITLAESREPNLNIAFLTGGGLGGLHLETEAAVHLPGTICTIFGKSKKIIR
jgi:hypothetical protein